MMQRSTARAAWLVLLPSCFSPQIAPTGVSSLQERLIAESLERAMVDLPLPPNPHARYSVEVSLQEPEQENFVRRMAERELMRQGFGVARGADSADVVLQLFVSSLATDRDRNTIGIPFLTAILAALTPALPGTDTTPLALYDKDTQRGLARVRAECRTPDRAQLLSAGEAIGAAYFSKTTLLTFIGPFTSTDLPDAARTGP
ncbi:MAG: hypothetical protein U1E76_13285 [Planctomycetota bacterium]